MPLRAEELPDVRRRLLAMVLDTIATFELIRANAGFMFGSRAAAVQAAIDEYLRDFIRSPAAAGEIHPEGHIYAASAASLQRGGFYGAQLDLKEAQVQRANSTLRQQLATGLRSLWKKPFSKWVDIINNFLESLIDATAIGTALKELKDCLRDELPDED